MTIALRSCKPGDKLEMRNGEVAEYVNPTGDRLYPHSAKMPDGTTAFFTGNGQFYSYLTSYTDIMKILPMQTDSTIPQRGTKEFARYAAETMMAGADGQDIESLNINSKNSLFSEVLGKPAWNWALYDYRIKPKPTVIPWALATCKVGSIIKTKKGFNRGVVIGANENYVFVFSKSHTYHDILADWTMDNGEPCGTAQQ